MFWPRYSCSLPACLPACLSLSLPIAIVEVQHRAKGEQAARPNEAMRQPIVHTWSCKCSIHHMVFLFYRLGMCLVASLFAKWFIGSSKATWRPHPCSFRIKRQRGTVDKSQKKEPRKQFPSTCLQSWSDHWLDPFYICPCGIPYSLGPNCSPSPWTRLADLPNQVEPCSSPKRAESLCYCALRTGTQLDTPW